ncbi:MAG: flagellar protein FlbA [Caulobacter sp.]|nr:flagellar protein FlbA [Caulobacter sp.]
MPRNAPATTAASAAILGAASASEGLHPRFAAQTAGNSGDAAALKRLTRAIRDLKTLKGEPALRQAVNALRAGDPVAAGQWAYKALQADERNGLAWHMMAIAREQVGDFKTSLQAYESALALLPDHADVANDLGRLAYRMGMFDVSEKLFRHYLVKHPDSHEAANNIACALRDQGRYDEAVDFLRHGIMANQDKAMLWNTMGTLVAQQGDPMGSMTFYDEALRLEPTLTFARYNRGNAKLVAGDVEGALEDCEASLAEVKAEPERLMMQLARSSIRVALGDVGGGWDDYEARLHPQFADVTHFVIDRPRWEPGSDLTGKTLLVMGEQGLGDEVMFANVLPDVIEALGPDGRLILALEARLVELFARSFPKAQVVSHLTGKREGHTLRGPTADVEMASVDLWTPLASLLRRFRRSVEAYPARDHFLTPDPARVAHWKAALAKAPAGLKVGILWKSLKNDAARARYFSPFDDWGPVFAQKGVTFVNLQYGETGEELAQARARFGVDIWTPPGIDLKQDLDDLAALTCALDLILAPPNATSNIAAACGAPVWLISPPGSWPRLGTPRYPWYPQAKVFVPAGFGDWGPLMAQVGTAIAALAAGT